MSMFMRLMCRSVSICNAYNRCGCSKSLLSSRLIGNRRLQCSSEAQSSPAIYSKEPKNREKMADSWKCTNCGIQSFAWRTSCLNCGSSKPDLSPRSTPATKTAHSAEAKETLLDTDIDDPSRIFGKSKPGDWICPGCGSLSFSWRDSCFNCGVLKPGTSIQLKPKHTEVVTKDRGGKGKKAKSDIVLKDLLQLCERSRDFVPAVEEAEKRLQSKDRVPASVLATIIRTFGKAGNVDRALEIFNSIGTRKSAMLRKRPSAYHYTAVITACGDNGRWENALEILDQAREGKGRPEAPLYTAAMAACGKAKQWKHALDIFDTMVEEKVPLDTVCYNSAIVACSHTQKYAKAFDLFEDMMSAKIFPDQITYGAMLNCCSKAGDWVLARDLLDKAKNTRRIDVNNEMVTSTMSAFTKGGEPQRALELFEQVRSGSVGMKPRRGGNLLLDYPMYSSALTALCSLAEQSGRSDGGSGSGGGRHSLEVGSESHSLRALRMLQEMAKRNIKVSSYALAMAIRVMDAEGSYQAAQDVYELGVKNKAFSRSLVDVDTDKDRRIDMREYIHPSLMRAVLRSFLAAVHKGEVAVKDILIVLGTRNKSMHTFVKGVIQDNIHPGTPIDGVLVHQGGQVLLVRARALEQWKAATSSSNSSSTGSSRRRG